MPGIVIANSKPFYWQSYRKCMIAGRLSWYGGAADDKFWGEHWSARLGAGNYYADAERLDLTKDLQGRIFVRELDRGGLHLEAGCGAGFWVAALRNSGYNVEGIEYSKELVKLVRERNPTLPVRWADALQIDRPDNHYDSYISIGVVEHRSEGPEPFLAEAFRVLRPGGRLLISVPFFGFTRRLKSAAGLFGGSPQGRFFQYGFGLQEFVSMVAMHGFDIRSTHRLYAHRLLLEECSLYRWLSFQRGARFVRKLAEAFIGERDGHMLMVLAQKPARDDRQ
jgi:SAM-dependent methyltransferase